MKKQKNSKPIEVVFSDSLKVKTKKLISEGAFAYVYLAEDQNGNLYALK